MTYADLKMMMFAFHNGEITRNEMICAIALWQLRNGFETVDMREGTDGR